MPKRPGYSTLPKRPSYRTERRIKMPQLVKRPLRFQARTLIRRDLLRKDPYWYTLHRRGPRRTWVGENPLEARAVPHSLVRGTLPERIVWKYLVEMLHFVPDNVDFDFQSSLQGGRIDTGGIVADFKFDRLRIIIQVQGPTHTEFRRIRKDDEQRSALEEMGFQVYEIWENEIYNEYLLDDWMRRTFNWYHSGGPDSASGMETSGNGFALDRLYASIQAIGA